MRPLLLRIMRGPMRPIRLILFAAGALVSQAATYYVDFAKGADANPGTAERAPWKTLEKVNASRFQPGDRILLKSGSVWQIGRAHVWTPVTDVSRMPCYAWK